LGNVIKKQVGILAEFIATGPQTQEPIFIQVFSEN